MKTDKIKNYIISFILFTFFTINIYQLSDQHWSAIMDMDSAVVYNSLLLASGYEQEFRDHPAFTLFLFNGMIFKLISLFQSTHPINIDVILESNKIDETFQYYFSIARIANSLINILFIYFFYKLLEFLKIKNNIIFLICLLLIFSEWFFLSFFALRVEFLSLVFFTISMIFIVKDNKNLYLNYFIAGIFLALAMLSKIQVIFLIAYPLFLIPFKFFKSENSNLSFSIPKNVRKYFLISFVVGILIFLIFQILIQDHPRFQKNQYLDLFLFSLVFVLFLSYYLMVNRFNFSYFKKNIILLSSLINGFIFLIITIFILGKSNFLPVNDYIFLKITNPIHYLTEFTYTFANGKINSNFIITKSFEVFSSYSFNLLELVLLVIIIFLTVKKNINKDNYFVTLIFVFFLIFILNATINSFKYAVNYHAYYVFCYLILFSVCINNLDYKISKYFFFIALVLCLYNSLYLNNFQKYNKYSLKFLFKRTVLLNEICDEINFAKKTSSYINVSYLKYYHNKFDDNKIKKLCSEV